MASTTSGDETALLSTDRASHESSSSSFFTSDSEHSSSSLLPAVNSDKEEIADTVLVRKASAYKILVINLPWFGLALMYLILTVEVVPAQVEAMVGMKIKGTVLGLMVAVGAGLTLVIGPLLGILSDRIQTRIGKRRPVMLASSLVLCGSLMGMALSTSDVTFSSNSTENECHPNLTARRCKPYANYSESFSLGGPHVRIDGEKEVSQTGSVGFPLFDFISSGQITGYMGTYAGCYLLSVIAYTGIAVPYNALIADKTHPTQRGMNSGIMGGMILLGNIGGACLGLFIAALGLNIVYGVICGIVLLCISITLLSVTESHSSYEYEILRKRPGYTLCSQLAGASRKESVKGEVVEGEVVEGLREEVVEGGVIEGLGEEVVEGGVIEGLGEDVVEGEVVEGLREEVVEGGVIEGLGEEVVEGGVIEGLGEDVVEGGVIEGLGEDVVEGEVVEGLREEVVEGGVIEGLGEEVVEGDSNFRWLFITRFMMQQGVSTVFTFIQYWVSDMVDIPNCWSKEKAVAVLMIPLVVAAAICSILFGLLSDRIRRRKPLVLIAAILMSVSAGCFTVIRGGFLSYYITLGLIFLSGVGYGTYLSVDFALLLDILPNENDKGKDIAVWNQALILPQVLATPTGGFILDLFEQVNCAVGLGYIILFALTALYFFVSGVFVIMIDVP
ncbi:uncharacterized protein [Watersipora subatra]|uniref:uncharacterized protein n=1 Tax=Watersipora subatra TaxID=2589382 RepID=UPI00355AF877